MTVLYKITKIDGSESPKIFSTVYKVSKYAKCNTGQVYSIINGKNNVKTIRKEYTVEKIEFDDEPSETDDFLCTYVKHKERPKITKFEML